MSVIVVSPSWPARGAPLGAHFQRPNQFRNTSVCVLSVWSEIRLQVRIPALGGAKVDEDLVHAVQDRVKSNCFQEGKAKLFYSRFDAFYVRGRAEGRVFGQWACIIWRNTCSSHPVGRGDGCAVPDSNRFEQRIELRDERPAIVEQFWADLRRAAWRPEAAARSRQCLSAGQKPMRRRSGAIML